MHRKKAVYINKYFHLIRSMCFCDKEYENFKILVHADYYFSTYKLTSHFNNFI